MTRATYFKRVTLAAIFCGSVCYFCWNPTMQEIVHIRMMLGALPSVDITPEEIWRWQQQQAFIALPFLPRIGEPIEWTPRKLYRDEQVRPISPEFEWLLDMPIRVEPEPEPETT
ncbi:MAG: hypothetical protein KGL39_17065 [Patescibacteria group bacterium]|nr:hypothetical protein [Patescibacteria group bacterium]